MLGQFGRLPWHACTSLTYWDCSIGDYQTIQPRCVSPVMPQGALYRWLVQWLSRFQQTMATSPQAILTSIKITPSHKHPQDFAGQSLKEILDAYVADSQDGDVLVIELRQVLGLAEGGANLFDEFERSAARFPDETYMQLAVALRQIDEAEHP